MITCNNLMGRLGNNMFMIAATIGHAVKCGQPFGFPEWKYQKYFKNPLPKMDCNVTYAYKEKHFHFNNIPCTSNMDLEGYFQSWKYFDHCKHLIRHYFDPVDEIKEWIKAQKGCSFLTGMHIRRGDYLGLSDYHTNLSLEYYREAMSRFPEAKTIVFSDDIPCCKENFPADYYSEGNEIQDLFLMASCENKIIANSSFSYWAAYLGGGDVVSPRQWFGKKLKETHDTKDLYLPGWIVI